MCILCYACGSVLKPAFFRHGTGLHVFYWCLVTAMLPLHACISPPCVTEDPAAQGNVIRGEEEGRAGEGDVKGEWAAQRMQEGVRSTPEQQQPEQKKNI